MQCERCKAGIVDDEKRELHGQILCEDCYMDLLSPLKACDPWAVHSAKSLPSEQTHGGGHTKIQQEILDILRERGPIAPASLAEMLQIKEG